MMASSFRPAEREMKPINPLAAGMLCKLADIADVLTNVVVSSLFNKQQYTKNPYECFFSPAG